MPENDKFYIERCLDGHPDDFRYLVRRYQGVLLANLAGKLGNKDQAEETAQETFVRAYFNINKLKSLDSFFSWILGIADRVVKEHQRKKQIQRQREIVLQVPAITQKIGELDLSEEQETELGMKLSRHLLFIRFFKGQGEWHYVGKDVKFGDAEKAIFWYQPKNSETYRVIYGDLSVKDVAPEDLPK